MSAAGPEDTARRHESAAARHGSGRPVPCAVLTVSDTRSLEQDASGARIITTLIYALRNRGGGRGIAAICIGGGEAVACAIEVA